MTARQPRALLQLGDIDIPFERMTLTHSGTYQAGTFDAELRSMPGNDVGQWNWWLQQSLVVLDVYAGFPVDVSNYDSRQLTRLFTVRADSITLDPARNSLHVQGRDMTALLIDTTTSAQFQNLTSSQVAQQFATQSGLEAQIQPTTQKIGTYYEADHVHTIHTQSQWAVLTYLARKEGVQCFVLGRTLYFGQFQNQAQQPYTVTFSPPTADTAYPTSNAMSLSFERDLTLARDVTVTVRSWNARNKRGFTVQAKTSGSQSMASRSLSTTLPKSAAAPQAYAYTIPGLSLQEAQIRAQQLLKEISQHELRLNASLPGDDTLFPWVPLQVSGTGTLFDTTYYVAEVTRHIAPTAFDMRVRAKNHPTETQVQLA
ncbi:MAG: hypothetical protein KGI52_12065 [Burkholderiales bacterium]|nr:hypothetical protein [Burkholderiales bacterium]